MDILIAKKPIFQLGSQFSNQNSIFHFSSIRKKNSDIIINFPAKRCPCTTKITTLSYASLDNFGGWDQPQLGGESVHSGESNLFHSFLISLGIDDKKYAFVYLLGFVCALALFRIKASSIIAFPACAVIFVIGFSAGFVNGGRMSLSKTKKNPRDDILEGCVEKFRNLVDSISEFDGLVMSLRNDINKGIERNRITLEDLASFLKTVESINKSSLNVKNLVEGYIAGILVENQEIESKFGPKSTNGKKAVGKNAFSLPQSISSFFGINSKPSKMKHLDKREPINAEVNGGNQVNILSPLVEERKLNAMLNGTSKDRAENMIKGDIKVNKQKMSGEKMDGTSAKAMQRISRYVNNQEVSWKMDRSEDVETWASNDGLLYPVDFSVGIKHQRTETSFWKNQKIEAFNGKSEDFDCIEETKHETYGSFIGEERVIPNTESSLADHESSEDMEFNQCLAEANILLKESKEYLVQQNDYGVAEDALHSAAGLLLKAAGIRPMSLLAVGQLGNTYLLHGELKLKISRELRALLAQSDPMFISNRDEIDDQVVRRDKMSSILVNVCEESEELLVKAGRKYRLALSIDGNDMRAMYNWGLALFFRAQLIADIGPAAASDADKVFLAAINKFDAMMSRSNLYAPDALFRWGAALQQRSRLRPRNSKTRVKLLQQARRLYEDALDMDNDNDHVRNALSSCVSELKYWYD